MNLTLICPSRNGVEFLEWSYNSIRKNQGTHHVEILVLDDKSDKDNTWEWCVKTMESDPLFKAFKNETEDRWGISGGHKFLSQYVTTEILGHWHNDMFLTEGTLDIVEEHLFEDEFVDIGYGDGWTNKKPLLNNVVCLTRIEPQIGYQPGPEKVIWNNAPIELEDWDEQVFLDELPRLKQRWNDKTTGGHFAPFFMFAAEYNRIGGIDNITFPKQSREDSDFAFRLVLAGFNTIQIPAFVFHFCSRGSRRQKYETDTFTDNPLWINHNINATRNFIRKWHTMTLHDEYLKPFAPIRYNVGFKITNCYYQLLQTLEPWCDHLVCDLNQSEIGKYIAEEQPNTTWCDLYLKINPTGTFKIPDIIVEIDGNTFTQTDFQYITLLSQILTDSGEYGYMGLGNLKLNIERLEHYENELIVVKNK